MDVKGVFLSLCLCTLVVTCIDAAIPRCCISTGTFPQEFVGMIHRVRFQSSNTACDIRAGVLYVKGSPKPICVDYKRAKQIWTELKKLQQYKMKTQRI